MFLIFQPRKGLKKESRKMRFFKYFFWFDILAILGVFGFGNPVRFLHLRSVFRGLLGKKPWAKVVSRKFTKFLPFRAVRPPSP